jgi:ribose 5-phosphate isomerase B
MNTPFPVAIGCDEAGFELKELLKRHIEGWVPVTDFGTDSTAPVLYPDIALAVATAINAGQQRLGVLVCGTGIGMAISANKVLGIRGPGP